ncbi:hypothetical protein RCL1_008874 [Eukaryota sp. TZLM3-RCL]
MASLVQPVIDQVISNCKSQGHDVPQILVAFALKVHLLKDTERFNLDSPLTSDSLETLKTIVTSYLCENSVEVITLKLQSSYRESQKEGQFDFSSLNTKKQARLAHLKSQLSSASSSDTLKASSLLLQYVMTYMSRTHGVNAQEDADVEVALQSVLPRGEVPNFLSLPADERVSQLDELAEIVHGITLLNSKDHLFDETSMALETVNSANQLKNQIESIRSRVQLISTSLSLVINQFLSHNIEPSNNGSFDRLSREFALATQYLNYLNSLYEDVCGVFSATSDAIQSFKTEVNDILSLIGNKNAVSKVLVYPKFISLCRCHLLIQNERQALRIVSAVLNRLNSTFECFKSWLDPEDVEKARKLIDSRVDTQSTVEFDSNLSIIVPSLSTTSQRLDNLRAQLLNRPELVHYVGPEICFHDEDVLFSLDSQVSDEGVAVNDQGVQTPVHFVERYKDYKYEFSEWKLRQHALKMVNLMNKVTHSSQTLESNFKKDGVTQVYEGKNKGQQTLKDGSSNTNHVKNYYTGIKGRPYLQPKVVNLEIEFS